MEIITGRLIEEPDITLISSTTPEVLAAILPAVENGFVLTLVICPAKGEGVLGPDQKCRPLATRFTEGFLECVRWLTGLVEEDRKLIWLRASGLTWRDIAEHTGIPRTSVHRYWHRALLRIVINQGQRQQI